MPLFNPIWGLLCLLFAASPAGGQTEKTTLEIAGVSVTPHVRATTMRYATPPAKPKGALVRLFVRNPHPKQTMSANEVLVNGKYPLRHIIEGELAWHDTPNVWEEKDVAIPPGAISVWSFNGVSPKWEAGRTLRVTTEDWKRGQRDTLEIPLAKPKVWLSSVTFLGSGESVAPDRMLFHVANRSGEAVRIIGTRLYLPRHPDSYRTFYPQPAPKNLTLFPTKGVIAAGDRGGAIAHTGALPLTYCVVEVTLEDAKGEPFSLWARLRIKREVFDIGAGWIAGQTRKGTNALLEEAYLKTLSRMHVNLGHHGAVTGYTDRLEPESLLRRYPMKLFDALTPISQYDRDDLLPYIHGVDALGEPQLAFSAGQRTPQEVWRILEGYAGSRLPTTITLNDEATWQHYAGLSDYPHHDNYRVTAPSMDVFSLYERWGEPRIGWGAPLETIGDLCRALREMSRPAPTAYWSQGVSNWEEYDGRKRVAPTPDEIRLQAYHALATRITSLYWFNLSLDSLVHFRDAIPELERIGREIRLLEDLYLQGDAYSFERIRRHGKPDWELSVIAAPQGALLFALDLDYAPDRKEKVFAFGASRDAKFAFSLPAYLRKPADLFRVDAEGVHDVAYRVTSRGAEVTDKRSRVGIYVATHDKNLRKTLQTKHRALIAKERALGFDPAQNDEDFRALKALIRAE